MPRGEKISDCEKYPLVTLGQWELKRVCIDVLDFGRSPIFFSSFCSENGRIISHKRNVVKIFLPLEILLQISYATESRKYKLIFNY
jgi:hypothetical protein